MSRTTFSANAGSRAPSVTLTYTAATGEGETIPLTGAQTYAVDLAMLPAAGAQGLLVEVDLKDAAGVAATAPVRVTLTPGGYVDMMPGGFLVVAAPGTAAGVTAMTLTSTASALVRVSAYG